MASSMSKFRSATCQSRPTRASLSCQLKLISRAVWLLVPTSVHKIDIAKGTQKEPWFIQLNPNGRIPVLVDRNRDDFTVFETAAILLYLEQHYDTTLKFSFDARAQPNEYSRMLQWIFFTVSCRCAPI